MQWRLIFTLILMVLVVIFSLANSASVPFNYLIHEKEISLALIIFISALVGAIAGVVAGLGNQFRLSRELEEREQLIRKLQRQADELKSGLGGQSHAVYDQRSRPGSSEQKE